MAVGLGSMDMPVPAIADWEWLNWKFARAVRAGDTIYARWTLTQKRAPVGDDPTAIVVWRVDVHTAAGALCAEGEVGASVLRKTAGKAAIRAEEPVVAAAAQAPSATPAAPRRSRRRRRPASGDGAKSQAEPKAVATVEAASAPTAERPAGAPRRRRRRRSPGAAQGRNGEGATGGADAPPPKAAVAAVTSSPALAPAGAGSANPLTRAIRRLRRP